MDPSQLLARDRWMVSAVENTSLIKLILWTHTLQQDPNRLDLLLPMQVHMVARIRRNEARLSRLKACRADLVRALKLGRPVKEQANVLRGEIDQVDGAIDQAQKRLRMWRNFGDAIAHIYQDKYSLKHLCLDAETNYLKPSAGSLSGKAGFANEWTLLKQALEHGVPAVLCDLTNVLRFGDLCLLAGPEPFVMERKSGTRLNDRGKRQAIQQKKLMDFLTNNGAAEYGGAPNVTRRALATREVTYSAKLDECIAAISVDASVSVSPEPGLTYTLLRADITRHELQALINESPLNTLSWLVDGTDEYWCLFYPFLLSLSPANALTFLSGSVLLLVQINLDVLCACFATHGVTAKPLMDGEHALELKRAGKSASEGTFWLSERLLARIVFEQQSLTWFAAEHARCLTEPLPTPSEGWRETAPPAFIRGKLSRALDAELPVAEVGSPDAEIEQRLDNPPQDTH